MDWMSEGTNTHEIKKKNIYIYIFTHSTCDLGRHTSRLFVSAQWHHLAWVAVGGSRDSKMWRKQSGTLDINKLYKCSESSQIN